MQSNWVLFSKFAKILSLRLKIYSPHSSKFGGLHLLRTQFKYFPACQGIAHHISCCYSSQQNDMVEIKNKHIVEISLSLLTYSSTPTKYLNTSFRIAIYQTNCVPSLSNKTSSPLDLLFKHRPSHTDLKVYGCLCFPELCPHIKYKLESRIIPYGCREYPPQ